ncbi:uncharacterized protein MKK02DRAFT_43542 [Dioszegia hungarica]|uniref:Uncharacterized protein n=1 Tax=Dioszegia hungarica TaxID=4972 RepID=A0AA38HEG1_9TREE|nr:uncharacterized protein MKK02DRAFT_43542 [Dioszegia hungarica]KAI9637616.1 hypothetical protein MKK02DRAFT_43542 [Dioszegia hungarica]
MNFQDNEKNSIQSLLAVLRSTQDAPTAASSGLQLAESPGKVLPSPSRALSRGHSGSIATSSSTGTAALPSTQQLNDLLRSVNGGRHPPGGSAGTPSSGSGSQVSRNLIEPFGPVKDWLAPSPVRNGSGSQSPAEEGGAEVKTGDISTMPFAKALPKLGEMIGDERFMSELRKMKADQDALERRMWAKQEKIKADHERSILAEREISRIARKPISAEKRAQWDTTLDLSLRDFQRQTCLPFLDALSVRQRERLKELGVPGLGGDPADEGTIGRWRRIMGMLQAGLEE